MQTILRQALGVVIGGLIVAAITLAPHVNAQEQLTVASLGAPLAVDETNQTDKRITYQGMLLDASGQPLTGTYYMVFSIYDSQGSNQPLWTQEFTGVTVTNGLFTVLLAVGKDGTAETLLFTGANRYLGVRVGGDPEATPRQPLLYVPYAHWSRNADSLDGKDSRYLPIVFGVVDNDGDRVRGEGFKADQRSDNVYEIEIAGVNYDLNDFVTIVTPISQSICPRPTVASTNSFEGKLLVELQNSSGAVVSCKFHFVTYQPKD